MGQYQQIEQKILTWSQLRQQLQLRQGQRAVFTNGCFDIVHRGHVDYLSRSRDLGDLLIVALNSDNSVRRLKGPTRPIVDQDSRAILMASFQFVDFVTIFDQDTPFELIQYLKPDILVKGGDYSPENIVGADIVLSNGGEVKVLNFVDGFSTTSIVQKMVNQQENR